jgi:hypothetical protein
MPRQSDRGVLGVVQTFELHDSTQCDGSHPHNWVQIPPILHKAPRGQSRVLTGVDPQPPGANGGFREGNHWARMATSLLRYTAARRTPDTRFSPNLEWLF